MKTAVKLFNLYQRKGESQRQTCQRIAKDLDINHKYFYQVMTGKKKPSVKLSARIIKLYREKSGKVPPAYKKRLVVSYDNQEKWKKHMRLGNSVRQDAFDHYLRLPGNEKYRASLFHNKVPFLVMVDADDELLQTRIGLMSNQDRVSIFKAYLELLDELPEMYQKIIQDIK